MRNEIEISEKLFQLKKSLDTKYRENEHMIRSAEVHILEWVLEDAVSGNFTHSRLQTKGSPFILKEEDKGL